MVYFTHASFKLRTFSSKCIHLDTQNNYEIRTRPCVCTDTLSNESRPSSLRALEQNHYRDTSPDPHKQATQSVRTRYGHYDQATHWFKRCSCVLRSCVNEPGHGEWWCCACAQRREIATGLRCDGGATGHRQVGGWPVANNRSSIIFIVCLSHCMCRQYCNSDWTRHVGPVTAGIATYRSAYESSVPSYHPQRAPISLSPSQCQ